MDAVPSLIRILTRARLKPGSQSGENCRSTRWKRCRKFSSQRCYNHESSSAKEHVRVDEGIDKLRSARGHEGWIFCTPTNNEEDNRESLISDLERVYLSEIAQWLPWKPLEEKMFFRHLAITQELVDHSPHQILRIEWKQHPIFVSHVADPQQRSPWCFESEISAYPK